MRRAAPLLALSLTIALPASLAVHPTVASSAPDEGPDVLEISDLRLLATGLGAPSDVAVGEDGTVYVLDGYGGFLHRYAPDGTLEDSLEVQGDPVGVGWGGDRVWVPRTDEAVVMAFEPATGVWHSHTAPDASSVVRFTDAVLVDDEMALVSQGGKVWMTPLTGAGGEWVSVTSTMPFLADATSDGQLVMADVQDDTIHMAEPGSVDWQQVAQWGVWEGGFLHPTGVAVDRRGRIFVADGFLGVVQVFNRDGDFLGALGRDEELLRLEHPMGVAVDGDHLYVCDWVTGQVLAMEVDDRTRPVTRTGLYRRKLPRVSYLESSPSPEQLLIPVCQTCHDGSVQNSAHVWDDSLEQHPVDIIPHKPVPPPFTVDDQEQLYCGTCHIPHRMGDAVDADAELMEVFLKEPRARSQLCRSCHTDVVAEVRHLTEPVPTGEAGHALGQVPRNVARTGVQAIDPEVERVECLDCHAAHGAVGESLLNTDAAASGGCTRCHIGVSPDRGARTHPVDRPLENDDVVRALLLRDVFLGPGDRVACLTCHDVHSSPQESWLTSRMSANERCIICHNRQSSLQGGGHDIRPKSQRHVATACLACHTLHGANGPALGRSGGDYRDPTNCRGCHSSGGQARTRVDLAGGHPLSDQNPGLGSLPSVGANGTRAMGTPGNMGCLTCHDPHASVVKQNNPKMLRVPGGDAGTCLACHEDKRATVGSDHDLRLARASLPASDEAQVDRSGLCLACHGLHRRSGWQGWNGPLGGKASDSIATRACLGCHEPGNTRSATVVQVWEHPGDLLLTTAKVPWHNTGELPLYDAQGNPTDDSQIGDITCLTCHDAHVWSPKRGGAGGSGLGDIRTSFLREGWEGFCAGCHGEEALAVYRYFHDLNYRASMRERSERRDWPIYQEEEEEEP